MKIRGWAWLGLLGAVACAPVVLSPRPALPPVSPAPRPPDVPADWGPRTGAVLDRDKTRTSTEGFAAEPLEAIWDQVEGGTPPLLTEQPAFDLPLSDDSSVAEWVGFLGARGGKSYFRTWLARSTRYVPLFYRILDDHGLPRDLVYLSMVESGFSPRAFSWASASGPWQFMPVTARRYGLRVGFWVDERRDFVASTEAAARHLTWLYSVFKDWHLAMAAYNAGAGGVRSALRKSGTEDFWTLQKTRRLRRETKQYVPKILASAIVSKMPERFGFVDVPYQPPLRWDEVTVAVSTSLGAIAEACGGLPTVVLENLNPALRVGVTPPGETWAVRVPPEMGPICREGVAALPPSTRKTFRYYEADEGETAEVIATRHGTTVQALLHFHGFTDALRLDDFAEIAVPVPFDTELAIVAPPERRRGGRYAPGDARLVRYRVRSGDSLWKIAQRFKVPIRKLRSWNGMWRSNALRIGQKLRVYVGRGAGRMATRDSKQSPPPRAAEPKAGPGKHRVREGESLWIIARRHGTTVERLRQLNGLKADQVLSIGQILQVR